MTKRRVLILHHVEEMWSKAFDRDDLCHNIRDHILRARYDRVILATLEGSGTYPEIAPLVDQEVNWSYAFEQPDYYRKRKCGINPEDIIPVSTQHNWAYVYQWIKELRGWHVSIAGGADGECLTDLQETLDHLGIKYRRIERCIF